MISKGYYIQSFDSVRMKGLRPFLHLYDNQYFITCLNIMVTI